LAEIYYIKKYDSKNNGLNSTYGGDGLGYHLHTMSEEEIDKIKKALSKSMTEYNCSTKWANTTEEDRKKLTRHLHNEEVYTKKSETLKKFYDLNPDIKQEKYTAIKKWREENPEQLKEQNRKAGLLGAAKVSKKVKVINPEGEEKIYPSKSSFVREHGHIINYILMKTKEGKCHKGWKGWEINE
jgi:hypothetical protein